MVSFRPFRRIDRRTRSGILQLPRATGSLLHESRAATTVRTGVGRQPAESSPKALVKVSSSRLTVKALRVNLPCAPERTRARCRVSGRWITRSESNRLATGARDGYLAASAGAGCCRHRLATMCVTIAAGAVSPTELAAANTNTLRHAGSEERVHRTAYWLGWSEVAGTATRCSDGFRGSIRFVSPRRVVSFSALGLRTSGRNRGIVAHYDSLHLRLWPC